ncbi:MULTISPECIES: DUF433 domain-containing protein [Moraxella]|uniref:DUF433 domain-containing protein n=1 Tax=Moraxella TaxID=475 RepID=UPI0009F63DE2|nr:DUF433 domain-containing protein [Moraxella sp. K1664]MBE9588017.1 DUF433 domain-containing protein [Moraxella sp. K1630]MBE9590415.1 DUF433 domain-containing protein [Moraxella sp. K127]MBE9595392.1 DUF433 domain-containing protein [Moraxella sp. K2450]MDI4481843.1 DUF433 domain-containing protein [Moraxella lacunata]
MPYQTCIDYDPNIRFGKPIIIGTRISVYDIMNHPNSSTMTMACHTHSPHPKSPITFLKSSSIGATTVIRLPLMSSNAKV